MMAIPYISKRFAMERFLGLTREEIAQNATLWKEENVDEGVALNASSELRGAGITANGMAGDIGDLGSSALPPEDMEAGAEPGAPAPAGDAGATPPPPA